MTQEHLIAKALQHLAAADVDTSRVRNGRVIEAAVVYFDSGSDTKTVQVTLDRSSGECLGATIADEGVLTQNPAAPNQRSPGKGEAAALSRAMPSMSEPTCSFCHQPGSKVGKLIAGAGQVAICNHCVALCHDVLSRGGVDMNH